MGLITFTGEPVMCVIFFTGIRRSVLLENRLDLTAEAISDPDNDFFENSCGKGKRFPIGHTYSFKVEEAPYLCC